MLLNCWWDHSGPAACWAQLILILTMGKGKRRQKTWRGLPTPARCDQSIPACISASEDHKTWRGLRLGALSETRSAYELDGTQPHTPTTSGTLNWTPQRSIHPPKAGEDCSNKNVKSNVRNRRCECKGAPPNTSCYCFHPLFFQFLRAANLTRAEKLQAGPRTCLFLLSL